MEMCGEPPDRIRDRIAATLRQMMHQLQGLRRVLNRGRFPFEIEDTRRPAGDVDTVDVSTRSGSPFEPRSQGLEVREGLLEVRGTGFAERNMKQTDLIEAWIPPVNLGQQNFRRPGGVAVAHERKSVVGGNERVAIVDLIGLLQ